jgi:hypothetical protein
MKHNCKHQRLRVGAQPLAVQTEALRAVLRQRQAP